MSANMGKPQRILSDHARHGKVFTPPMLSLGEFKDISWFEEVVPELLWIALLVRDHSLHESAKLSLNLAKASAATIPTKPKPFFALASAYAVLTPEQTNGVNEVLGDSRGIIAHSLGPLLRLYPLCPLRFLVSGQRDEFKGGV